MSNQPPIPASSARTQGAVFVGGESIPQSITDRCGTPPRGVCDRKAHRSGSARRAPHPHRPPSMARSMRTQKPYHMAQRRGSAPRAPNPRCLAPNSVARTLNLLPRPTQGARLISPGQHCAQSTTHPYFVRTNTGRGLRRRRIRPALLHRQVRNAPTRCVRPQSTPKRERPSRSSSPPPTLNGT